jgi:hypothetical protein
MKPELDTALTRNKFARDWKVLRKNLEDLGLPVEVSEDSFSTSVPLARSILMQVRESRPKPETLLRCDEASFQKHVSNVFDALGHHSRVALSHWLHVGALRCPSVALESKLIEVLHFDGDTVIGCDDDQRFVFAFDFDPDYAAGQEYEVLLGQWVK